jgi:hypothetical protein
MARRDRDVPVGTAYRENKTVRRARHAYKGSTINVSQRTVRCNAVGDSNNVIHFCRHRLIVGSHAWIASNSKHQGKHKKPLCNKRTVFSLRLAASSAYF